MEPLILAKGVITAEHLLFRTNNFLKIENVNFLLPVCRCSIQILEPHFEVILRLPNTWKIISRYKMKNHASNYAFFSFCVKHSWKKASSSISFSPSLLALFPFHIL